MRLTCPNCGVDYEVPDGMVPAGGRHVQCTACHTRWFVRGGPRGTFSEDQILSRLETWRPRPVAVPDPAPAPEIAAETEADAEIATLEPVAEETTTVEEEPEVEVAPAEPEPAAPTSSAPRPVEIAKPGDRPSVQRPLVLAETSPPAPRPATRLELGTEVPAARTPEPAPSRFGRGFLVALILALLALGAYFYRAQIADRVPATGPALAAYADEIDKARDAFALRYDDIHRRIDDYLSE